MLVECSNCGAPLDVEGNKTFVACSYCNYTNKVRGLKTLHQVTPADWKPPPVWTPPSAVAAPSRPLHFHVPPPVPVKAGVGSIAALLASVIGVGVYAWTSQGPDGPHEIVSSVTRGERTLTGSITETVRCENEDLTIRDAQVDVDGTFVSVGPGCHLVVENTTGQAKTGLVLSGDELTVELRDVRLEVEETAILSDGAAGVDLTLQKTRLEAKESLLTRSQSGELPRGGKLKAEGCELVGGGDGVLLGEGMNAELEKTTISARGKALAVRGGRLEIKGGSLQSREHRAIEWRPGEADLAKLVITLDGVALRGAIALDAELPDSAKLVLTGPMPVTGTKLGLSLTGGDSLDVGARVVISGKVGMRVSGTRAEIHGVVRATGGAAIAGSKTRIVLRSKSRLEATSGPGVDGAGLVVQCSGGRVEAQPKLAGGAQARDC